VSRRIIEITVRELQAGDQVLNKGMLVYEILEIEKFTDDEDNLGAQTATVQWRDGGRDHRAWNREHLDQKVQVCR
jgi:hypothetical protein